MSSWANPWSIRKIFLKNFVIKIINLYSANGFSHFKTAEKDELKYFNPI